MVYVSPVKGKRFNEMKESFEKLFKQMSHLPSSIFSDRGLEFVSKEVNDYMENQKGIRLESSSVGQMKASIADE